VTPSLSAPPWRSWCAASFGCAKISLNPLAAAPGLTRCLPNWEFQRPLAAYHWLARGLVPAPALRSMAWPTTSRWSGAMDWFSLFSLPGRQKRLSPRLQPGSHRRRSAAPLRRIGSIARWSACSSSYTRKHACSSSRIFHLSPTPLSFGKSSPRGLGGHLLLEHALLLSTRRSRPFKTASVFDPAATSFWLCAYTGRFIFPLLSLKAASSGSWACCLDRQRPPGASSLLRRRLSGTLSTLVLFSDLMLHIPGCGRVAWLTAVVLSLG